MADWNDAIEASALWLEQVGTVIASRYAERLRRALLRPDSHLANVPDRRKAQRRQRNETKINGIARRGDRRASVPDRDAEREASIRAGVGGILLQHLRIENGELAGSVEELERQKDEVYLERNQVVAALSKCFPAVRARTAIEGWSEDWHGVVYVNLPAEEPTPGMGGEAIAVELRRVKGESAGELLCTYRVSEVDRDLTHHQWILHERGYLNRLLHKTEPIGSMHEIIAKRIWGSIPDGYETDHIDRDTKNNTRPNLRLATRRANNINRTNAQGRVYERSPGRWRTQYGDPLQALGTYDTKEQADAACRAHIDSLVELFHKDGEYIYPPLQVSWHYHDSQEYLFEHLPLGEVQWDGHDTPEKYRRLAAIAAAQQEGTK